MRCDIYRSSKKSELYVYIARTEGVHRSTDAPDDVSQAAAMAVISAELKSAIGRLSFVMHLDLSQTERLARAPIDVVKVQLAEQGYYIQLPPEGLINLAEPAPEGLRGA